MNILLIGPQGSGKGTQARMLVEKFNFYYFESGAFLREIAEKNKDLKDSLAKGNFVPDAEMSSYVTSYLDEKNLYDNILFDGFPRSVAQNQALKNWMIDKEVKIDLVLLLQIGEEETIRRLSARRMNPVTGKIYNLVTDKPSAEVDINTLVQRDDDKPEAIKKRLGWYHDFVKPLVAELEKESKVVSIDGERPIEAIFEDLVKIIVEAKGKSSNGNLN